jgi:RNA polymerase sigma-70 factor, ECF subfamily
MSTADVLHGVRKYFVAGNSETCWVPCNIGSIHNVYRLSPVANASRQVGLMPELLLALSSRDPTKAARAWEMFCREHNDALEAVARSILHDDQLAADCVNEVYLNTYRAFTGRVREVQDLVAWMTKCVRNKALDVRRHRDTTFGGPGHLSVGDLISDGRPSPGTALGNVERAVRLNALIATFPEVTQKILKMRYFEGLPSQTIADALGMADGAVRARISRALSALREFWGESSSGR